ANWLIPIGLFHSASLGYSIRIEALDEDSFRVVLNSLQSGNLIGGRGPALFRIITAPATGASTKEQIAELDRLLTTIEESPVPAKEWEAMREIFDDEELSRFLDASTSSIKRYSAAERSTPVETADRLHWLAMVVADLAIFSIWGRTVSSKLGLRTPALTALSK